jgi:hypothetical protein
MRGMHLAGHARKKCGFIWNKDDAARESEQFDVKAVALAIGAVAGKNGPLEFVYLNACATELMGRLLREFGVPHVVCWLTPVQDETAREFCFFFYRALVEDASGARVHRDYLQAFFEAVDDMRARQGTGAAAAQRARGAGASVASVDPALGGGVTRNTDSEMELEHDVEIDQCGGASARGHVLPGQQNDIVMLLSKDGDRSCWLKT